MDRKDYWELKDSDLIFPQCNECRHKTRLNCEAFPDGIPDEIFNNDFIHNKVHPEQKNEIIFERN